MPVRLEKVLVRVTILCGQSIRYLTTTLMSTQYRPLFVILILLLAIPGFSQDPKKAEPKSDVKVSKEEPRADGLKRISGRPAREYDFDIDIDEKALEANIERAVERAMRDVEEALDKLERLDIHIEPIEINLGDLNLDIDPIEIQIPDLDIDIDIEPLDMDMDIDIDHDFDHDLDWDNDNHHDNDLDEDEDDEDSFVNKDKNKDKLKEKDKQKNKSDQNDKSEKSEQKEKDKAKGLKKIN